MCSVGLYYGLKRFTLRKFEAIRYSQRRLRKGYISRLYGSKRRFTCSSLLTRQSISVLKVGVVQKWQNVSPVLAKED